MMNTPKHKLERQENAIGLVAYVFYNIQPSDIAQTRGKTYSNGHISQNPKEKTRISRPTDNPIN